MSLAPSLLLSLVSGRERVKKREWEWSDGRGVINNEVVVGEVGATHVRVCGVKVSTAEFRL